MVTRLSDHSELFDSAPVVPAAVGSLALPHIPVHSRVRAGHCSIDEHRQEPDCTVHVAWMSPTLAHYSSPVNAFHLQAAPLDSIQIALHHFRFEPVLASLHCDNLVAAIVAGVVVDFQQETLHVHVQLLPVPGRRLAFVKVPRP